MKVVLLAGGRGTRISEETDMRPKPMVEIGGKPILWHIMKLYSHYGHNEFIICLGYKGYLIKEYFANYYLHMSNVTLDLTNNSMKVHQNFAEPWKITLVDTGLHTLTGGRIKRVKEFLGDDDFMMTYGDGVADVDVNELLESHRKSGKLATVTSVQPFGRFGSLTIDDEGLVEDFLEKPKGDGSWINGGFFVLNPEVIDCIDDDDTIWEKGPLENLAKQKQLNSYQHENFWKPMDTLRDKLELEELWNESAPPWKVWDKD